MGSILLRRIISHDIKVNRKVDERAQLALFLLESLEPAEGGGIEEAWRIEAESHLSEIEREETRMHIHVTHTAGEAKFWLEPKIELALNQGLSRQHVNEALALVRDHHEEIVHAWRIHFGD